MQEGSLSNGPQGQLRLSTLIYTCWLVLFWVSWFALSVGIALLSWVGKRGRPSRRANLGTQTS